MPLHPELVPLARFLDAQAEPFAGRTAQQVREGSALLSNQVLPVELRPPVGSTEDIEVDGARGRLMARVYRPSGTSGPLPTIAFFHGGGFVLCSVESHDAQCRELCQQTGSVVVSVEYGLAPESPFPGPVQDALAATRWVLAHAGELGGSDFVAVAGDSAGGNLSAVVSQELRGQIGAALLLYPVVDMRSESDYPSAVEHADDGVILTAEAMMWFGEQYLGGAGADGATADGSAGADPQASPILGDLAGLPPTLVTVAEMDPLRDQGKAYAAALEAAGSPVRLLEFPGLIHGYFALGLAGPASAAAVTETCEAFRAMLTP